MEKIYTENELAKANVDLIGKDLVVFDLDNPEEEYILYGFDEIGSFDYMMKSPRYKIVSST